LKPSPAARLNGFTQTQERPEDIAHMVKAILEMDDRGFTPELSIFATNPRN
jgi:3-oxoacyl-[acyl-carrier protein] reductase